VADRLRGGPKLRFDEGADLIEPFPGLRFEPESERRLGIGRPNEAPAVFEIQADAVSIVDGPDLQ
jgi:hypothetical protein